MIKLDKISKEYLVNGESFKALDNISLSFSNKGFVAILGPSGCGKTTLLNIIGGLDHPTDGDIIVDGISTKYFLDNNWDNYRNKRVGFVFQNYNLIPNLTIVENVSLSLRLSGKDSKLAYYQAIEALEKVGLADIAKKKANVISGGQAQRVAIARAIINNPDIILADEPTGALDSESSKQILDILKKVSKDHLVIMVTHAKEYAYEYADRIISLKDGIVIDDSNSKISNKIKENDKLYSQSKMPFLSLIKTSWKNFIAKKKRSIAITAATSIGVFGVALTIALTNGLNNYVSEVETSAATTVPISITPFVSNSVNIFAKGYEKWPDKKIIIPYDDNTATSSIHHNNITKDYFNYAKKLESMKLASSVIENHEGLDFNILTTKGCNGTEDVFKVNQFMTAGEMGSISSSLTNVPSSIFHELYGDEKYITSLYDVIEGHFPKNKNEVVLAVDRYNRIPVDTLKALGIINTDTTSNISFSQIIGKKNYKLYSPDQLYTTTNANNAPYETKISNFWKLKGETLEDLKTLVKPDVGETKILYSFDDITNTDYSEGQTNLNNFYKTTTPAIEVKVVGIIRLKKTTQVSLIPGSICYTKDLKDYYVNLIKNNSKYDNYRKAVRNNWYIPRSSTSEGEAADQLKWEHAVEQAKTAITKLDRSAVISILNSSLFEFRDIATSYYKSADQSPKRFSTSTGYTDYLSNNLRFATEFKTPTLKKIGDTYHVQDIDDLMDLASYISGYSTITSILIFPKNLSVKSQIHTYLDKYNENLSELNQIKYADLADSLTNSIGSLVTTITISLISFSAIALLISSILTGVIAYTSVVERTKEIGILRSVGARKKDVRRLFEFETMIIGLFAGLVGIIIVYIIEMPVSLAMYNAIPGEIGQICNLNPLHALLILLISILLSFISGFIPARLAAKKDPVEALRDK